MSKYLGANQKSEESMSQVSMKNGYWFYFDYNGHEISVHGSAWSGKESVYVDNHPVSVTRNLLSRKGVHHFTLDAAPSRVEYLITNFMTGELNVSFYVGDELIEEESKAYYNGKKPRYWFTLLYFFAGGFAGYFGVKLLTEWLG